MNPKKQSIPVLFNPTSYTNSAGVYIPSEWYGYAMREGSDSPVKFTGSTQKEVIKKIKAYTKQAGATL